MQCSEMLGQRHLSEILLYLNLQDDNGMFRNSLNCISDSGVASPKIWGDETFLGGQNVLF